MIPSTLKAFAELDDALAENVNMRELIVWLSRMYEGGEPIFATENWDHTPIESGARLQATWRDVVGEGIPPDAVRAQCPTCGTWAVRSVIIED
jgi:hypothetical protein